MYVFFVSIKKEAFLLPYEGLGYKGPKLCLSPLNSDML